MTNTPAPDMEKLDAEIERILAMSDEEILASTSPEDRGWAKGMKEGIALGRKMATLAKPAAQQEGRVEFTSGELLDRDDARLALFQAIEAIKIGNKTDDKLILDELGERGFWICRLSTEPAALPKDEEAAYLIKALLECADVLDMPGDEGPISRKRADEVMASLLRRAAAKLIALTTPEDQPLESIYEPCDCCGSKTAHHDTACHHYGELRSLPEDQVTSETERSMLSGQIKRAGADHAPCPAASNGSVAKLIDQLENDLEGVERSSAAFSRLLDQRFNQIRAALSTTLPERDEVVEALRNQGLALADFVNLLDPVFDHSEAMTGEHQWRRQPTRDEVQVALKAQNEAAVALSKLKPSREGGEG